MPFCVLCLFLVRLSSSLPISELIRCRVDDQGFYKSELCSTKQIMRFFSSIKTFQNLSYYLLGLDDV